MLKRTGNLDRGSLGKRGLVFTATRRQSNEVKLLLFLCATSFCLMSTRSIGAQKEEVNTKKDTSARVDDDKKWWVQYRRGQRALIAGEAERAAEIFQALSQAEFSQSPDKLKHVLHGQAAALMTAKQFARALKLIDSYQAQSDLNEVDQLRGWVLQAEILERTPGKLGAARKAWVALEKFLKNSPGVVPSNMPRAHIRAIDRASKQEHRYRKVRARIAQRKAKKR